VKAALPEPAYPVRGRKIAPPQAPTSAPKWNQTQEEVHWLQRPHPLSLQWLQCPY
jgi:hypothetical protein